MSRASPMARRARAAGMLLGALACLTPAAHAAWLPSGTAVLPPFFVQPRDYPLSVAADADGGAYILAGEGYLWMRLARITHAGEHAQGWPEDAVSPSPYPWWPFQPVVVPDDSGGAYVVSNPMLCEAHCAGNSTELRVQRLLADSHVAPGWPAAGLAIGSGLDRSTPIRVLRNPASIPNGSGSLLTTWSQRPSVERGELPVELRAQRVDPDGALPWGLGGVLVHSFTSHAYHQSMAADGRGGAYVFWLDEREPGLYAQRVRADGAMAWGVDGLPVASPRSAASGAPVAPVAMRNGEHGAVVVWVCAAAAGRAIFAARVGPEGSLPWRGERLVFAAGADPVDELSVVPAGGGGAFVAWRLRGPDGREEFRAQRLSAEGERLWPRSGMPVCRAEGTRSHLAMAADGHGGAYFAWLDGRPRFAVYATRLDDDGRPARGWSVDGTPLCARLPRTGAPGGFHAYGSLAMTAVAGPHGRSRAAGEVGPAHEDDDVASMGDADPFAGDGSSPGLRPSRRSRDFGAIVAWTDDAGADCSSCDVGSHSTYAMLLTPLGPAARAVPVDSASVAIPREEPGRLPISRVGIRSLPAGTLAIELADSGPARLELFDVGGRRLWVRAVGGTGPGEFRVRVGDEAAIPTGIYFVRLTQAGVVATRRVAILR